MRARPDHPESPGDSGSSGESGGGPPMGGQGARSPRERAPSAREVGRGDAARQNGRRKTLNGTHPYRAPARREGTLQSTPSTRRRRTSRRHSRHPHAAKRHLTRQRCTSRPIGHLTRAHLKKRERAWGPLSSPKRLLLVAICLDAFAILVLGHLGATFLLNRTHGRAPWCWLTLTFRK